MNMAVDYRNGFCNTHFAFTESHPDSVLGRGISEHICQFLVIYSKNLWNRQLSAHLILPRPFVT